MTSHLGVGVRVGRAKVDPVLRLVECVLKRECEVVIFLVLPPDLVLTVTDVLSPPDPADILALRQDQWLKTIIKQRVSLYQINHTEPHSRKRFECFATKEEPLIVSIRVCVIV